MRKLSLFIVILVVLALVTGIVFAATGPKTRIMTGLILSLTDDSIVIKKGKGEWEIIRNADTQITGNVKVGAEVTIQYQMIATAVKVKNK